MTKKKLIAFDLDGTLAVSKSPLPNRMADLLDKLLDNYQVLIISGGKYELFERQVLGNLRTSPDKLTKLHLMPTSGTRYYKYDQNSDQWRQVYAEDIPDSDKKKIINALNEGLKKSGWEPDKTWGSLVEDRDSQITLSILGQEAPIEAKEAWDPTGEKKLKLRDIISPLIPDYEVRAAGTTSIDVTKPGIDKAYGMQRLLERLTIDKEEVLFVGDKLMEGGNDYPVKAMGIECREISHWQETAMLIEEILNST